MLPLAIRLAAMGYHFEKVTRQQNEIRDYMSFLETELERFDKEIARDAHEAETLLPPQGGHVPAGAGTLRIDSRRVSLLR